MPKGILESNRQSLYTCYMGDTEAKCRRQLLPTGTVTFLFTDIESSTRLAQQYPEAMPALLARHHEILHQVIQTQNGYVFQIFAWAGATREKIGDHRPPMEHASVERDLAVIHSELNESDIASLSAAGQAMTLEEAVALALEN